MELRTADPTDLDAIQAVAARSLAASYDHVFDESLREQAIKTWYGKSQDDNTGLAGTIDDEDTVIVVAEANATADRDIAGFAQAVLVGGEETVGRIEWIHVDPDHRGSGLGSNLLDRTEAELVDEGADRVEGRVLEANQEGLEFYERRGYETGQTRRLSLGDETLVERTLVRDRDEPTDAATDQRRVTEDDQEVFLAYDDSAQGSDGPFYGAYLDQDREQRYGWYCGVCDSLDVNMDAMGRLECSDCGNQRQATRWDATYGG